MAGLVGSVSLQPYLEAQHPQRVWMHAGAGAASGGEKWLWGDAGPAQSSPGCRRDEH